MYVTSIKDYLLLDEVQFMSRFEEVLNSLLRISNIDVYVTGSNSKFLSSDIVTEFRGRGDEIRIYPLSFAEFYAAFDGDYDDAWEEYMIYGGLPQVLQFSVERQKAEYLKNIFTNVYIKDVVERNKLRNVDEIDTLVDWRLKHRYFLEFLARNNALYRDDNKIISDGALVAITLMIAESRPEEKDIMVNLVMNFF